MLASLCLCTSDWKWLNSASLSNSPFSRWPSTTFKQKQAVSQHGSKDPLTSTGRLTFSAASTFRCLFFFSRRDIDIGSPPSSLLTAADLQAEPATASHSHRQRQFGVTTLSLKHKLCGRSLVAIDRDLTCSCPPHRRPEADRRTSTTPERARGSPPCSLIPIDLR